MQRIDLFPSGVYKTKIDPSLWNKRQFIEQSIENYNIDPHRHSNDMPDSDFHTTYLDDGNEKFNVIDTESLGNVYSKIISDFFNELKLVHQIEYRWDIVNISIGKDNWYDWHYHGGLTSVDRYSTDFVMVHYVKFDPNEHNPTCFKNPLICSLYSHNALPSTILDSSYCENSAYSNWFQLDTNEDDVVIFPSYLYHGVLKKNNNTEKFRIITSTHIDIKYNNLYCER